MDHADREKFRAWIEKHANDEVSSAAGPVAEKHGVLRTCLGGPIDGMLAGVAESIGTTRGASLLLPANLVLAANPGAPERLVHRYARDHRGAYVYVGTARASEVAS